LQERQPVKGCGAAGSIARNAQTKAFAQSPAISFSRSPVKNTEECDGQILENLRTKEKAVVTQLNHKDARSVPEGTGRNGRYKTPMRCWWQVL